MNLIPGLSLRAPEEDEIMGIDDAEIGEFAVSMTWEFTSKAVLIFFLVRLRRIDSRHHQWHRIQRGWVQADHDTHWRDNG